MKDWEFYTIVAVFILMFAEISVFIFINGFAERVSLGILVCLVALSSAVQGMAWAWDNDKVKE